jgi:transposase
MSAARRYQKYPESLRLVIAKSGNPYSYPEYKVPRTTALYWIKNGASEIKAASADTLNEQKVKRLEQELAKERALISLVEKIRTMFPLSFKETRVPSKPLRRKIVAEIRLAAKFNKVCDCLKIIGLSKSTYSNWLSEFYLCEDSKGKCKQRKPHQLTHDEVEAMRKLITSKKYSHFSIQSLCLFAKRKGLLFCSLDSWYKYKKMFGWVRAQKRKLEKPPQEGIRAKRPNEIWHIDVTQVKIASSQVVYIQVIYDNYSRFVLAWKVTTEISALNTVALIAEAKKNALKLGGSSNPTIISDGGPENDNH